MAHKSLTQLIAAATIAAGLSFSGPSAAEPLHLVTESYPPMNYAKDGELTGMSVELLRKTMADAGIDYDMEIMPWARAYALAEGKNGYCVFTTVHNAERDKQFQWIEPLLTGYAYLIKKRGSDVEAHTLQEARKYLVGTQRGDYTVGVLKTMKFDRIDLAADIDVTLKKLLLGRVDLMPMYAPLVAEKQKQGVPIEAEMVLVQNVNGLACNKEIDPAIIARIQSSLDKLVADGTQKRLAKKYGLEMPSLE